MASPKLRFKEFNGDWVSSRLGEVSDIKTGPFGSTLHQEDYVEIGTPIITVEHLGEIGITNQNLPLVSDEDKLRLKSYVLQENDLAFSRVGSVDRCSIITKKENGWLFSGRILRVRPNKKIHAKNLMYALKTEDAKYRIRSVAVGQTMPSLNTEILKNFIIALSSSKEEQTKIASFLSAVDEKINQLTQKHSLLSQYKQGMMQKLFSQQIRFKADDGSEFGEWQSKTLGEVGENIIGLTYSPTDVTNNGSGILVLRSSNIKNGRLDKSDQVRVNKKFKEKIIVQPNDILICTRNGSQRLIGKSVIINDDEVMTFGAFMSVYRSKYNRFIAYLMQTPWFFEQVQMNLGARINQITTGTLNEFTFNFPSLEEQTKIAHFLSAIDQKIEVVAQQIAQAKQWKKGVLQQMFV